MMRTRELANLLGVSVSRARNIMADLGKQGKAHKVEERNYEAWELPDDQIEAARAMLSGPGREPEEVQPAGVPFRPAPPPATPTPEEGKTPGRTSWSKWGAIAAAVTVLLLLVRAVLSLLVRPRD